MIPRHRVAAAVAAALPDWTVHPAPGRPVGPASAVIGPGVPYVVADTFCGGAFTIEVALFWTFTDPDHDFDHLETVVLDQVWPSLAAVEGVQDVRWERTDLAEHGGTTFLSPVIALTVT